MENVAEQIGMIIKKCRQNRNISQEELAKLIHKSKSTLSKYEKGEISIDISTLTEISEALEVPLSFFVESISGGTAKSQERSALSGLPAFFQQKMIYMYYWDGRSNAVNKSALVIEAPMETNPGYYQASLYMNVKDFSEYYFCENPYKGHIEFHHVLTGIYMIHKNTELEHIMIIIPENFADSEKKWGIFSGVSFRPVEPAVLKVVFSKTPMDLTPEFVNQLRFSKKDIKKLKANNYLSISQEF